MPLSVSEPYVTTNSESGPEDADHLPESRDKMKILKLYPDSENMNSYILTVVYWFQLKRILYNYSLIVGPNPSSALNCRKTKTYFRRFIRCYVACY